MCLLVEHHDHVKDLLEVRFREISSSQCEVVANGAAKRFAKRAASMVSAYENTVICLDCNTADPEAKKAVEADRNFSFSPSELRRIIRASPNSPHKHLDIDVAREVWNSHLPSFQLRMKIIGRIAEIAAKNVHWFQEGDPRSRPDLIEQYGIAAAGVYVPWASEAINELCGGRRLNKTASHDTWRTRQYPSSRCPPSDGAIEHVAKVDCAHAWRAVPDSWICEGCGRSKRQTVRPSKQSPWFFKAEERRLSDPSRPGETRKYWLCEDCCWTARELGREAARMHGLSINSYSQYVALAEIVSIVQPRPHAMHQFKNDQAEIIVNSVASRMLKSDSLA